MMQNYTLIFAAVTSLLGVGSAYEASSIVLNAVTPPPIEGKAAAVTSARGGDTVLVSWAITKRTSCPGESSRVWDGVGGFHMTEPAKPTSIDASPNAKTYIIPTEIPALAPVGRLELRIVGWYQCPGSERVTFSLPTPGPIAIELKGDDNG